MLIKKTTRYKWFSDYNCCEISEVENKIRDNSKYITTREFNKLTAENFEAKLK